MIFRKDKHFTENNPYTKVTGCLSVCLSVCLYRRISLTAEPIGFFLTGYILIGPGKVFNYFRGGYHNPPKRNRNLFYAS